MLSFKISSQSEWLLGYLNFSILSFAVYPFILKSSPGILGHQCVTTDCSVLSVHALSFLRALWLTAYQHCPWIQYVHLPSTSQIFTCLWKFCLWITSNSSTDLLALRLSFSALGVWRSVSLCLPAFVSRKFTVTTLNFDQFDKAGQFCCVFLFLNYHFFTQLGILSSRETSSLSRPCNLSIRTSLTSIFCAKLFSVDRTVITQLLLLQMFLD